MFAPLGPRLLAVVVACTSTLSACSQRSVVWQPPVEAPVCPGGACADLPPRELCEVVLCLAGAGGDLSDGNHTLGDLCAALDGLVQTCDANGCERLFPDVDSALLALEDVGARVDGNEYFRRGQGGERPAPAAESCTLTLIGHSWGAVNAAALAQRVAESAALPPGLQRVERAVLLDAYSPFAGDVVDVPDGVRQAWSYRHSTPDPDDCSARMPLGPYVGLPIRCGPDTQCADYDLSLLGLPVGHCEMLYAVDACVHENVRGQDCSAPPPSSPVLRR